MQLKTEFNREDLKKAVEILGAECYRAMSLANALGGMRAPEWDILHNNKWADIVVAAQEAGLDFNNMKCAVTESPLMDSLTIQYALGQITDLQRKQGFNKYIRCGNGKWPNRNIT